MYLSSLRWGRFGWHPRLRPIVSAHEIDIMPDFSQNYRVTSHKSPGSFTQNVRSGVVQNHSILRTLKALKHGKTCEVRGKYPMTNAEYLPRDETFHTAVKELTEIYRIKEREWLLNIPKEKLSQCLPEIGSDPLYMVENCRFYFEIACTLVGTKPCVQFHWLGEEAIEYFNQEVEAIFAPLFKDFRLSQYGFEFSQATSTCGITCPLVLADKLSKEWPLVKRCILNSTPDTSSFDIGTALGYPLPCHLSLEMENLGRVKYNDRTEQSAMKDVMGAEVGGVIAFDYFVQWDTTFENFLTMLNHFQRVRKTGQDLGKEIVLDLNGHPVFNDLANELVVDRDKFEEKMSLHRVRREEIPVLDACHLDRPPPVSSRV